jgi:methyltransferase (TIGR00027 family)
MNVHIQASVEQLRPDLGEPDSPFFKPLREIPDNDDLELHRRLCCTELVTKRLGELVPLLKFVGFRIEQMAPERTALSVPLLESAMNQNGTHQAAVFYLLADYTLGIGMFAVLPGCYTIGVHDRCRGLPVQFWLKSGSVEHRAPATGTMRAEVSIPPDIAQALRAQLIAKGRCEFRYPVNFYQDEQLVAVAQHEMGLFADAPCTAGAKATLVQRSRLKTSALMIAGLRGDAVSTALAQDQGVAIARRMTRASPQLPALVAARDRHLRAYLSTDGKVHSQVLVLGAGLDSKPIDFATSSQRWFLCDLADMLRERETRLAKLGRGNHHSVQVPVDLRSDGWPKKIISAGFDPSMSSLVILEGVSMYLERRDLNHALRNIHGLCAHPGSRLWLDHVTQRLLAMDSAEVTSFLSSMARLGEPFVTGFSDLGRFVDAEGLPWSAVQSSSASEVLGTDEAVAREYRFALMRSQE